MNSQQQNDHFESLWWMRNPSLTIYGHGTFVSPETLSCLLTEERLSSSTSTPSNLSSYLEWFLHEAKHGIPPKNPSNRPEDEAPSALSRPRLLRGTDQGSQFYEALNLFLDSIPFEYFTLPSSNQSSVDDQNRWNPTSTSESSGDRTLLRLPFPATVPLEAIQIIEPAKLPGCDGLLFPDVNKRNHQYSVSETEVKRQIQQSLACLILGNVDVRSIDESKHLVQSRFKLIQQENPSDDDDEEDEEEEIGSTEGTARNKGANKDSKGASWNSAQWNNGGFDYQKNPDEAILFFKKDFCPGEIIGPPVGGELLLDEQSMRQISANKRAVLSPEEAKNESAACREQNFETEQPLSSLSSRAPSDFEEVGFASMLKPKARDTSQDGHDAHPGVVSRSKFLSSKSICNEFSVLMKKHGLTGNVGLLTATVYGIPYAFVVTGANCNEGTTCVLNWNPMDVNNDLSTTSGDEQNDPPRAWGSSPLPLPLKWNLPDSLDVGGPSIPFSLDSQFQISALLQTLELDDTLHRTVLLMAKVLISDGCKSSATSPNTSNCIISSWKSTRDRLPSSSLPSFKALTEFLAKHQLHFKNSPLLLASARVLITISNILNFFFSLQSPSPSSSPSSPQLNIPSSALASIYHDTLQPLLLHQFIVALKQFAKAVPSTTAAFKAIFSSPSDKIAVLVFPFHIENDTKCKDLIKNNMGQFQSIIGPKKKSNKQFARLFHRPHRCAIPPTTYLYPSPLCSPYLPRESFMTTSSVPICTQADCIMSQNAITISPSQDISSNPLFRYSGLICPDRETTLKSSCSSSASSNQHKKHARPSQHESPHPKPHRSLRPKEMDAFEKRLAALDDRAHHHNSRSTRNEKESSHLQKSSKQNTPLDSEYETSPPTSSSRNPQPNQVTSPSISSEESPELRKHNDTRRSRRGDRSRPLSVSSSFLSSTSSSPSRPSPRLNLQSRSYRRSRDASSSHQPIVTDRERPRERLTSHSNRRHEHSTDTKQQQGPSLVRPVHHQMRDTKWDRVERSENNADGKCGMTNEIEHHEPQKKQGFTKWQGWRAGEERAENDYKEENSARPSSGWQNTPFSEALSKSQQDGWSGGGMGGGSSWNTPASSSGWGQQQPWTTMTKTEDVGCDSPEGKTETEDSEAECRTRKKGTEQLNQYVPKCEMQIMKLQTWACREFKLSRKEVEDVGLPSLLAQKKPDVNLMSYVVLRVDRDQQGHDCDQQGRGRKIIASGQPVMMRGPGQLQVGSLAATDSPARLIAGDRKPVRDAILLGLKNYECKDDSFKYEGWKSTKKMLKGGGMRSHGPSINKGNEDALELTPPVNLGREFTIDVWIRLPAAGQGPCRTLLSNGWDSIFGIADDSWMGQRTRDKHSDFNKMIVPIIEKSGRKFTPNLTLEHRGWHRLVFSHSVSKLQRDYYLDGYYIGSCPVPNRSETEIKFLGCLWVGKSSRQCFGAFARLKMYDHVFSENEIAKLYGLPSVKTPQITTPGGWDSSETFTAFKWVPVEDSTVQLASRD